MPKFTLEQVQDAFVEAVIEFSYFDKNEIVDSAKKCNFKIKNEKSNLSEIIQQLIQQDIKMDIFLQTIMEIDSHSASGISLAMEENLEKIDEIGEIVKDGFQVFTPSDKEAWINPDVIIKKHLQILTDCFNESLTDFLNEKTRLYPNF